MSRWGAKKFQSPGVILSKSTPGVESRKITLECIWGEFQERSDSHYPNPGNYFASQFNCKEITTARKVYVNYENLQIQKKSSAAGAWFQRNLLMVSLLFSQFRLYPPVEVLPALVFLTKPSIIGI